MEKFTISYLSSVAKNYPFGVPKSLCLTEKNQAKIQTRVVGQQQLELLLVDATSQVAFEDQSGLLLEQIISKGLQLEAERVAKISFKQLVESVNTIQTKAIIVFGDQFLEDLAIENKLGEWQDYQQNKLMLTYSLKQVIADPALKKLLWGHLKIVLALIK